jgi:YD repeat-containing protein
MLRWNAYIEFRYDTLISNLDEAGNILSATRILFNYLHLPMQEFHYSIQGQGQLLDAYQAQYTYFIPIDQHARSTNYMYPIVTEQLHYNTKNSPPSYQGLRRATAKYDDYGCMHQSLEEMWDLTSQTYVKQKSMLSTFTEVAWGGEMVQDEIFIDEITGFQRQVLYTLTGDQKQIQSTLVQHQAKGDQGFQPWKTKSLEYDANGRVTLETVSWSDGVVVPVGSVPSYTNQNSYQFDPSGYDIVIAKDPQGQATISKYDLKITRGLIVYKELPLGQVETFSYDLIGRCIGSTDPFGKRTTTSYTIGAAGNTVTSTSPLGYVTREIFDALGRTIELRDNGDPTQRVTSEPTRVLSQVSYDSLSRVISKSDELGLVTTYNSYDAFNRVLSITDPEGNVQTHVYDDSDLSTTHRLNGDLRATAKLDGFARNVFTTKYADSGDRSISYSLGKQYTYDGFGNVVQTSLLEMPLNGGDASKLEIVNSIFNVENAISRKTASTKTDIAENSFDFLQRDIVYDIFGLCYSQLKTVQYHDGASFEHPGSINIRDNCKLLVTYKNQLGQEEKYDYDANGYMSSLTRFDGTFVSYTSDAIGRLTGVSSISQNLTKSYLENGRVSQITTSTGQTEYKYALDGCSVAVIYSDNAQQSYTLDKYSRIVQDHDARGTVSNLIQTCVLLRHSLCTDQDPTDARKHLRFSRPYLITNLGL